MKYESQLDNDVLILKDEQLYELPENWIWTKFGNVAKLFNGYAFKSADYINEGVPVIRISDISGNATSPNRAVRVSPDLYQERFRIKKGDLLIAMSGATTGKTGIYNSDEVALQNQRVGNIKGISEHLLFYKYKNYFIFNKVQEILNKAYGGAQPNVSGTIIEQLNFPLPPLNEQKRIAEKVEYLLSKIDEANHLIEEAKQSFELRRAAILDKAFRGELTRKWRLNNSSENRIESNGKDDLYPLPDTWEWIELSSIIKLQNGMSKRKGSEGKFIPVLRLADIQGTEFQDNNLREILLTEKEIEKYKVFKDDILFIRVNGSIDLVGKAISFSMTQDAAFCDHLIRGSFDKHVINSLYIKYLFESSLVKNQLKPKIVSSAGQNTVSQGSLGAIKIPLPPLEEMNEIVRILEKIISKEENIFSIINNQGDLNLLKQSILSKAFRGELNTNEPREENPLELLKEVLQEKLKK